MPWSRPSRRGRHTSQRKQTNTFSLSFLCWWNIRNFDISFIVAEAMTKIIWQLFDTFSTDTALIQEKLCFSINFQFTPPLFTLRCVSKIFRPGMGSNGAQRYYFVPEHHSSFVRVCQVLPAQIHPQPPVHWRNRRQAQPLQGYRETVQGNSILYV